MTFSMIVGLLKPHGGRIVLDDVDITRLAMHKRSRQGLVYLPQERSLFRGLTAEDNVAGVLEFRGSRSATAPTCCSTDGSLPRGQATSSSPARMCVAISWGRHSPTPPRQPPHSNPATLALASL